ncbi:MAG TPA: CinA family protein [Aestuariivirgaceae bacterium]|jgi:nicotinamide-nucleotide amidase
MFDAELTRKVEKLLELCREKKFMIATAESCTGGLLAALLTEIPGSSRVYERGYVTYSNEAKSELLGVSHDLITRCGAVSEAVAVAMAEGSLNRSRASIAASITGVAGPGGGTVEKPVGLVYLACVGKEALPKTSRLMLGASSRQAIREAAVIEAVRLLSIQASR